MFPVHMHVDDSISVSLVIDVIRSNTSKDHNSSHEKVTCIVTVLTLPRGDDLDRGRHGTDLIIAHMSIYGNNH